MLLITQSNVMVIFHINKVINEHTAIIIRERNFKTASLTVEDFFFEKIMFQNAILQSYIVLPSRLFKDFLSYVVASSCISIFLTF